MLKISESCAPACVTLQLSGRLAGEWIRELMMACDAARAQYERVALDFADLTFVDRTGAALIRSLLQEGMSLVNCSLFITEQLKQSGD